MEDDFVTTLINGLTPSRAESVSKQLRDREKLGTLTSLSLVPETAQWGSGFADKSTKAATQIGQDRLAQEGLDQRAEDMKLRRADQQLMRAMRQSQVDDKVFERLSKEWRKESIPAMAQAFTGLDATLKPYLAKEGEEQADIPGLGATGWLPGGLLSSEGRQVKQSVAAIRNQFMRAMAGAAQTNPEAARLREQIGDYLGGSDEDVIRGMQILKELTAAKATAIEAGFDPTVVDEFKRRIGPGGTIDLTEEEEEPVEGDPWGMYGE